MEAVPRIDDDKALGALLGLAVGDALGAPLEGTPAGQLDGEHSELTGGGPHGVRPGQGTGDTQMALITNLPRRVTARKVANAYRKRWTIETGFAELTDTLACEIDTLRPCWSDKGSPHAGRSPPEGASQLPGKL